MNREKVLVVAVDDTSANRTMLERFLGRVMKAKGADFVAVHSIEEANQVIEAAKPHSLIALIDENLDGESGVDFAQDLTQRFQGNMENLLRICISGSADELDNPELIDVVKRDVGGYESIIPVMLAFLSGSVADAKAAYGMEVK